MRYARVKAGLGAIMLVMSVSFVCAGEWERDARSKVLGDIPPHAQNRTTYRVFNYVPAPATPTVKTSDTAPAENPQPTAQKQATATRSFSYQPTPAGQWQNFRRPVPKPNYTNAERKTLGEY